MWTRTAVVFEIGAAVVVHVDETSGEETAPESGRGPVATPS
jgi:hypothetical protein